MDERDMVIGCLDPRCDGGNKHDDVWKRRKCVAKRKQEKEGGGKKL